MVQSRNDYDVEVIEYLKKPPSVQTLSEILQLLELHPSEFIRSKESIYQQLGLNTTDFSEDALIEMMVEHPILMERSIVLANDRAALGRPPGNIQAIL